MGIGRLRRRAFIAVSTATRQAKCSVVHWPRNRGNAESRATHASCSTSSTSGCCAPSTPRVTRNCAAPTALSSVRCAPCSPARARTTSAHRGSWPPERVRARGGSAAWPFETMSRNTFELLVARDEGLDPTICSLPCQECRRGARTAKLPLPGPAPRERRRRDQEAQSALQRSSRPRPDAGGQGCRPVRGAPVPIA